MSWKVFFLRLYSDKTKGSTIDHLGRGCGAYFCKQMFFCSATLRTKFL